jgi:hypothetical protein
VVKCLAGLESFHVTTIGGLSFNMCETMKGLVLLLTIPGVDRATYVMGKKAGLKGKIRLEVDK